MATYTHADVVKAIKSRDGAFKIELEQAARQAVTWLHGISTTEV
jgi:hypothetical protein